MLRVRKRGPLYCLIAAGGFSMLGNAVASVALPWFVLSLTDSATWTGAAAAVGLGPLIVGSFVGGMVVDRFGSRRVAVMADLLSAVSVAAIAVLFLSGHLTLGVVLCLIAVGALLDGPGSIALDVRIPDLARLAGLPIERVTAIDEMLENGAAIVGPPLAGLTIAAFGMQQALFLTAACSLIAAMITFVAMPRHRTRLQGRPRSEGLMAGVQFLMRDPLLRALLWLFMLVIAIFAALNAVVMPVMFQTLGAGALDLGTFFAATAGGAVAAALIFAVWGNRADGRMVLVLGLFVASAAIAAIAVVQTGPLVLVAAVVMGLSVGALGPLVNAVFLRRAPAAIRGSVLGAATSAALIATPVAILVAGFSVDALGASTVLTAIAAVMVVLAEVASANPAFRHLTPVPQGDGRPDRSAP